MSVILEQVRNVNPNEIIKKPGHGELHFISTLRFRDFIIHATKMSPRSYVP